MLEEAPIAAPKEPKARAKRDAKIPVTPLPDTIVVENEEDPAKDAAELQVKLSELTTTVPVFDVDGRETTLESLEVELQQLEGRIEVAKSTKAIITSGVREHLKRLKDSVNQARALVGAQESSIKEQIKVIETPDPDVDTSTEEQKNAQLLLDIMTGKTSPNPEVAAKAAAISEAKSKVKAGQGVLAVGFKPEKPEKTLPVSVYKSGVFRNTTEAQLYSSWVAGGFMVSNLAEHGYDPKSVSGIPFQSYSVEVKQRLFKAITDQFPLIPTPKGTTTIKSNYPTANMDRAGRSYLDIPVVVDSEGTPIAGVFTNNPLVTASQIDKGLRIVIPKSVATSKGFSRNPSIIVQDAGKGSLLVSGVKRHPNDTVVSRAGDISLVGKTGYAPKKAMESFGNMLRNPHHNS